MMNESFGSLILRDNWRFALNPCGNPASPDYDDSRWRRVTLPHDWQIEGRMDKTASNMQGFFRVNGIGWYRSELTADENLAGKVVRLLFDGVQRFYTIYLNGVEVGSKAYGYVPYFCELPLTVGRNVIAVKVDNDREIDGVFYKGKAMDRWYSGEGIYRTLKLDWRNALHIVPDGIRAEYTLNAYTAAINLVLNISNRLSARNCGVRVHVTAPNGIGSVAAETVTMLEAGENRISLPFTLENVALWDIDDPKLYEITVELVSGNQVLDTQSIKTGFRTSVFDADCGYALNGREVKLAGVDLHHDYGGAFGAAVEPDVLRRRLERLKAMGCNAIRCSHNPKEVEFYELCDELGFLVIDELYDKWRQSYYTQLLENDWEADMDAWMNRDYNHPCVILWSVGNECCDQFSEAFFADLKMLTAGVRARDLSRPVSYALIGYGEHDFTDPAVYHKYIDATLRYAEIVDVFMGNYMENFYRALRKEGMRRCIIGSEVFEYFRLDELSNTQVLAQNPWNDVRDLPYVVGGFIWAGIDYLGESTTWPVHGWTGCPMDSAGFIKLRGEYTKSVWAKDPMVKIAVFDERDPYDGARCRWGFPQMVSDWYYPRLYHMQHVGVYTNCDKVTLTFNDGVARTAIPDSGDHMAHFLISFIPGKLEAKGYINGEAVASQVLYTSDQAEKVELSLYENVVKADGHSIFHVEGKLLDKFGQVFIRERPKVKFTVEGPATLLAVDNGDFNTETEICRTDTRTFWNGNVVAYLRTKKEAGTVTVKAEAEGFAPVEVQFETQPVL